MGNANLEKPITIFSERKSNVFNLNKPRIWGKQHVNRAQRRLVEKEYSDNDEELGKIEDVFIYEVLFGEFDYQEVYPDVLLAYENMCAWIESVRKPKAIILNKEYFVDLYKPIEEEPEGKYDWWPAVKFLHEKIRAIKFVPGADMIIGITNFNKQTKVEKPYESSTNGVQRS